MQFISAIGSSVSAASLVVAGNSSERMIIQTLFSGAKV